MEKSIKKMREKYPQSRMKLGKNNDKHVEKKKQYYIGKSTKI